MPYLERIRRFQELLDDQPTLIHFPLSADLQYLTGINRPMPTYGTVRHPGDWIEGLWMTNQCGPILVFTRMTAEFYLAGQDWLEVRLLGDWTNPENLLTGILRDLSANRCIRKAVGEGSSVDTLIYLQSILPEAKFISATEQLFPMRMIKAEEEVAQIRKAGEITEAAFADVLKTLKPGISELEVISEVDFRLRQHGSQGSSFDTTLYAVGPQHELILGNPQRSWPRRLESPVALLFDFGAVYQGYCYDFGRTVSFGEPSSELRKTFDLVMAAQAAGIAAMQAGVVTASQVDRAARQVIEEAGLGEAFRHRLGHGIGLDVHEPPFLTEGDETILQTGMLFTVEPSVLIPFGGSARVEDVVLVGEDGGIPLTSDFQSLIVID